LPWILPYSANHPFALPHIVFTFAFPGYVQHLRSLHLQLPFLWLVTFGYYGLRYLLPLDTRLTFGCTFRLPAFTVSRTRFTLPHLHTHLHVDFTAHTLHHAALHRAFCRFTRCADHAPPLPAILHYLLPLPLYTRHYAAPHAFGSLLPRVYLLPGSAFAVSFITYAVTLRLRNTRTAPHFTFACACTLRRCCGLRFLHRTAATHARFFVYVTRRYFALRVWLVCRTLYRMPHCIDAFWFTLVAVAGSYATGCCTPPARWLPATRTFAGYAQPATRTYTTGLLLPARCGWLGYCTRTHTFTRTVTRYAAFRGCIYVPTHHTHLFTATQPLRITTPLHYTPFATHLCRWPGFGFENTHATRTRILRLLLLPFGCYTFLGCFPHTRVHGCVRLRTLPHSCLCLLLHHTFAVRGFFRAFHIRCRVQVSTYWHGFVCHFNAFRAYAPHCPTRYAYRSALRHCVPRSSAGSFVYRSTATCAARTARAHAAAAALAPRLRFAHLLAVFTRGPYLHTLFSACRATYRGTVHFTAFPRHCHPPLPCHTHVTYTTLPLHCPYLVPHIHYLFCHYTHTRYTHTYITLLTFCTHTTFVYIPPHLYDTHTLPHIHYTFCYTLPTHTPFSHTFPIHIYPHPAFPHTFTYIWFVVGLYVLRGRLGRATAAY